MPVVRTIRVREDRVRFPASRQIRFWARRIVAIYGIRIAGTRFRLPPGPQINYGENIRKLKQETGRSRQSN